jgi:hypothetical protein
MSPKRLARADIKQDNLEYARKAREFKKQISSKAREIRIYTPLDEEYLNYIDLLASNGQKKEFEKKSIQFEETLKWFNRKFIGLPIKNLLDTVPPLMLMHFKELDDVMPFVGISKFVNKLEEDDAGGYIRHTNKIILAPGEKENDGRKVICHELLHYSGELGNGGAMFWFDERGRGIEREFVGWLDEGLTELFAQQKTREKGYRPTYVAYMAEVMAAIFIQRLVGERMLRIAYLSGDYSEVKRKLEKKIGFEKFDETIANKEAEHALSQLAKEVFQHNLSYLFLDCFAESKRPFRKDKDIERAAKKALESGKKYTE